MLNPKENYLTVHSIQSNNFAAGVRQDKYQNEIGFNYDALGIGLSNGFFDSENDYISVIYLDHELTHLDYFVNVLKMRTGSQFNDWKESNPIGDAMNELGTIQGSLEMLKRFSQETDSKGKPKISQSDYERVKKKFGGYAKEQENIIFNYLYSHFK